MANRLERVNRALDILKNGDVIHIRDGLYYVKSSDPNNPYLVTIGSDVTSCSCPDFRFRGALDPNIQCKHILATKAAIALNNVKSLH